MKAILPILLLSAALPLTTAVAQNERGPGWEFGADLIYQDSQDIGFNGGTRIDLEDDFGFSLSAGYRFNSRFELQFGLDWQSIDYDIDLVSADFPGLGLSGSGDLEAFTPWVNAKYNFMEGPITPYVMAGVGWSFVDTNIPKGPTQIGCWWDPWWGYVCTPYQNTKSVDDFAYQAGLGVRWDISPGYSLRLAYEKHWLDLSNANSTPDFDQYKFGFSYRY